MCFHMLSCCFLNWMNHRPKIPTIFQCIGENLDRGLSYYHACPGKGNSATATIYTGLPWFTSLTQSTDCTRSIQTPIVSCCLWNFGVSVDKDVVASPLVWSECFDSFCSEEAVRALNGFDKSSHSAPGKLNHSDLKIEMYWNVLHTFVIFCQIVACLAVKKQFLKGRVDGIKVQANFAKEREERRRADGFCLIRLWTMQVECKWCIQGHLSYQIPVHTGTFNQPLDFAWI